jgi:uncharacterized membrane protein YagU involved in acid resistance
MNKFLTGALAGLAATVPMTLAMEMMYRQLPKEERFPLPPRRIIEVASEKVNLDDELDEEEKVGLTLVSHFGYGTTVGTIYSLGLEQFNLRPTVGNGVAYGVSIWALSYLGLLPATGLLSSAAKHPANHNLLMITAHVIWGATLGAVVKELNVDGGIESIRGEHEY